MGRDRNQMCTVWTLHLHPHLLPPPLRVAGLLLHLSPARPGQTSRSLQGQTGKTSKPSHTDTLETSQSSIPFTLHLTCTGRQVCVFGMWEVAGEAKEKPADTERTCRLHAGRSQDTLGIEPATF